MSGFGYWNNGLGLAFLYFGELHNNIGRERERREGGWPWQGTVTVVFSSLWGSEVATASDILIGGG